MYKIHNLSDYMLKDRFSFYFTVLMFSIIIISIIIFPESAYKSSLDGLNLWLNVVCPSLLPFFITIDILISLGIVKFLGVILSPPMSLLFNIPGEGAFAFIMSIASGYPMGAKVVTDLRKQNICTKHECQRMLSLCSTSGPLFIIGAVSVGMLNNMQIAPILLIAHYLSAISIGLLMRFYKKDVAKEKAARKKPLLALCANKIEASKPLGEMLAESIKNSINLILLIGGYIVFFSVLSGIIKNNNFLNLLSALISTLIPNAITSANILPAFLTGILEVTNGIKECVPLAIPYTIKITLISFFIGFGGISVNAQVSGIIYDTDLGFGLYFFNKILQGIFASTYTFILMKQSFSYTVFNHYLHYFYKEMFWCNSIKATFIILLIVMCLLLLPIIIGLMFSFIKRILNRHF